MSEKKHRAFTAEFKQHALELLKRGEKSAAELERDLGITPGLLGKWKARYQVVDSAGPAGKLVSSEVEAAKAEVRRLQRELANVTEEREILKKALLIFSRKNA